LSEMVPEKLPLAWPYSRGQIEPISEQKNTASSTLLVSIKTPLFQRPHTE
jgi:hypothetical protein